MSARVAIVGGGISGLAAAYYLSRAGLACTLVDPAPRLGGVISTETVDGCVVEAGPDSFIAQKPWALELIRELGLDGEVIGSNDHLRKTYILRRGRLVPMPDGLFLMIPTAVAPLVATPLLGWLTKIKMARELLRRPPAKRAEQPDRSVAALLSDHYGQEAVDYLAEPLLAGIYGGNAAELSAASVLPRFVALERRYGSLTRGVLAARREQETAGSGKPAPLFLTLKRGMQQLIDGIEGSIAGRVQVVHAAVESIEASGSGYRLHCAGRPLDADHVVVATPAHAAAALVRALDAALAEQLAAIPYHSSITIALGYDRASFQHPLNGFGFLVPRVERGLVTACTWVGVKFAHRVPENRVLLRVFIGAGRDEAILGRSDDSLIAATCYELRRLMGVTAEPRFARVARWPRAMAQYTVGHQRRVDQINARLAAHPGLYVIGNAYLGIGIPDCIRTAQIAAARITGALPPAP
ncbi:MAG TPA: protoporphyrinogen oxidase, partial [Bryobacterales bacterium]|nr:protoporphyrinogen oxidase [Bryobacterales bacterium]